MKTAISVIICGPAGVGKSTIGGRLIIELGDLSGYLPKVQKDDIEVHGDDSSSYAFFMNRPKNTSVRILGSACNAKNFFTEKWHYTVFDPMGDGDLTANTIAGAAQSDVAVLVVPAGSGFDAAIQEGERESGRLEGPARQYARLLRHLGIRQLIVCVNGMDGEDAGPFGQARFETVAAATRAMLMETGWGADAAAVAGIPIIPVSGKTGANLLAKSESTRWFTGAEVVGRGGKGNTVYTLLDALNDCVEAPARGTDGPIRALVSDVRTIKGVGDVVSGRVIQGTVPLSEFVGAEVTFVPYIGDEEVDPRRAHTFFMDVHGQKITAVTMGDFVTFNIVNVSPTALPRVGDVMVRRGDPTLARAKSFTVRVRTLDALGEVAVGHSATGIAHCASSVCKIVRINRKTKNGDGGDKVEDDAAHWTENPGSLGPNEIAEVVFEPLQPFVVDAVGSCDALGRIAFFDAGATVMLGEVLHVEMAS